MKKLLIIFLSILMFIGQYYAMGINNNRSKKIVIEQQRNYKKVPWYKRATFKKDLAVVGTIVVLCMTKIIHSIEEEFIPLQNLKTYQEEVDKYNAELKKYKEANFDVEPCTLCEEFPTELSYEQCTCRKKINRYLCDECMIGCTPYRYHRCPYCRTEFCLSKNRLQPIKFKNLKGEEPEEPKPKFPMARAGERKKTLAFSIAEWLVNL